MAEHGSNSSTATSEARFSPQAATGPSRAGRARRSGGNRGGKRGSGIVATIAQIVGELLITAGLILVLYVVWELWWTNIDANSKQSAAVENLLKDFEGPVAPPQPESTVDPAAPPPDYGEPAVLPDMGYGETFAVVYVPRFGENYSRPVTSGTGTDVLDTLGLGHYQSTAMPGEVGNFAVAGHRQTHGQVLDLIHTLVPGDRIYVQTRDGYYTYVFRNNQIVLPDRTDVLAPVPTQPGAAPTERILTMTSCNPRYGAEERIIAYSVMESWQPASAGPPAEIAAQVAAGAGRTA